MANLELAGKRLEVLAKAEAERRTAIEELLKASREESNTEELIEASREAAKAAEKLTKLARAKQTVRNTAQAVVYAADNYSIAEALFTEEVIAWEIGLDDLQCSTAGRVLRDASQHDGLASRSLAASWGPCLPFREPIGRSSTYSEAIRATGHPGHHPKRSSPPQAPSTQADIDFDTLRVSEGAPLLGRHSVTDMGLTLVDLPHRETGVMDAMHRDDVVSNKSSISGGPRVTVRPRSLGADKNNCLDGPLSFQKPSRSGYLHRRGGPRPYIYRVDALDDWAETLAMAVRDRLEAAEELVKVARKVAGSKQKLHGRLLAKVKENLTKANEEVADAEIWFRKQAHKAEMMSKVFLRWHSNRQQKKSPQQQPKQLRHHEERSSQQQQGTMLLIHEERSVPKKGKRSRPHEERDSEKSWKMARHQTRPRRNVFAYKYRECWNEIRAERGQGL